MSDTPAEPTEPVELVAVYKLPASLIFTGSCLGTTAPVTIAGLDGEVYLPSATAALGDMPILLPPSLDDLPSMAGRYLLNDDQRPERRLFWGAVIEQNTVAQKVITAKISALLFRFKTVGAEDISYSNYLYGRGHPIGGAVEQLFVHIDAWFERVRLWVRVLTDQDVDEDVEVSCRRSRY